jgi:L-asparaginase
MTKPRIAVIALGGTIAMTPDQAAGGVVPSLSAADITGSVSELEAIAVLETRTLLQKPGPHLTLDDAWLLANTIDAALAGCTGVVVTQGTDTIEEMAFILDLFVKSDKAVVVTGAMRPPLSASADGTANLIAAVRTAASPAAAGLGVMVVLNDEIHAARFVRKMHTSALAAFRSPLMGPIGWVTEGEVRIGARPIRRRRMEMHAAPADCAVALLSAAMGDHGGLIEMVPSAGYHALVFEGFGAGHVSGAAADSIERVVRKIPVVVASRTGIGETFTRTYGFAGSEVDLQKRGVIMGGWLDGPKSRILLAALLMSRAPRDQIAAEFAAWRSLR